MTTHRLLRLVLLTLLLLLGLVALASFIWLSDTALSLWQRLQAEPDWVRYAYAGLLVILGLLFGWLVIRLPRPRREVARTERAPLDEKALRERIVEVEAAGVAVPEAEAELAQLAERRDAGRIEVAVFGEISSGKSSLVKALLPGGETLPTVDVAGGTTRALQRYRWTSPAGDALELIDMPGLNEAGTGLDPLARDEAVRAHLVIFVCDGDLTRSQFEDLQRLAGLGKPMILALNKIDRFDAAQREQLRQRLRERVGEDLLLVEISAGGSYELERELPDGTLETVRRDRPARLDALREALQRSIDRHGETLAELRDAAVFVLVGERLDAAQALAREQRAMAEVRNHSRKAVVGALAAVAPGTDLLIQGYLASQLVRALAEIHQVPVREIDTELLLKLAQGQVGKTRTLLMAVAGNALKAFPGVGTLAGGLLHAVAYGMIFESLGKALHRTLASRGELRPRLVAASFKEELNEPMGTSARRLAKLAWETARDRNDQRD